MYNDDISPAHLRFLFCADLTEKVNLLDRPYLTKKVKKFLVEQLIILADTKICADGSPPLRPNQFKVECDGKLVKFSYEQNTFDGEQFYYMMCGTKTYMTAKCLQMVRDPVNLSSIVSFNQLVPYLLGQPQPSFKNKWLRPPPNNIEYETPDCPCCLEVWSTEIKKRNTICGHPVCKGCFHLIQRQPHQKCPVCRADYNQNGTIQRIPVAADREIWLQRMNAEYHYGMGLNGGMGCKTYLKRFCDITRFQNEYVANNGFSQTLFKIGFNPEYSAAGNGCELVVMERNEQ